MEVAKLRWSRGCAPFLLALLLVFAAASYWTETMPAPWISTPQSPIHINVSAVHTPAPINGSAPAVLVGNPNVTYQLVSTKNAGLFLYNDLVNLLVFHPGIVCGDNRALSMASQVLQMTGHTYVYETRAHCDNAGATFTHYMKPREGKVNMDYDDYALLKQAFISTNCSDFPYYDVVFVNRATRSNRRILNPEAVLKTLSGSVLYVDEGLTSDQRRNFCLAERTATYITPYGVELSYPFLVPNRIHIVGYMNPKYKDWFFEKAAYIYTKFGQGLRFDIRSAEPVYPSKGIDPQDTWYQREYRHVNLRVTDGKVVVRDLCKAKLSKKRASAEWICAHPPHWTH